MMQSIPFSFNIDAHWRPLAPAPTMTTSVILLAVVEALSMSSDIIRRGGMAQNQRKLMIRDRCRMVGKK
jgi:hypothetical protein